MSHDPDAADYPYASSSENSYDSDEMLSEWDPSDESSSGSKLNLSDSDEHGITPLHKYCSGLPFSRTRGLAEGTQWQERLHNLLEVYDVNAFTDMGYTPLHLLAHSCVRKFALLDNADVASILIEGGADIRLAATGGCHSGKTALQILNTIKSADIKHDRGEMEGLKAIRAMLKDESTGGRS